MSSGLNTSSALSLMATSLTDRVKSFNCYSKSHAMIKIFYLYLFQYVIDLKNMWTLSQKNQSAQILIT